MTQKPTLLSAASAGGPQEVTAVLSKCLCILFNVKLVSLGIVYVHKRHPVPFCHDAEAGRLLSELDLWRSPFYPPGRNRLRTIVRASS